MNINSDLDQTVIAVIKQQLADNPVILYMKGTPEQPRCGFSAQAVRLLKVCGSKFAHVDVLEYPEIRRELPHYAKWPTFPQLYIKTELIGGCDIMQTLYETGELQKRLKVI